MADDTVFKLKYDETVSTLSKAAEIGNVKLMKVLLKKGRLPQTPDNRGWCAMHTAAAAGQFKALRLLLNFRRGNRKYLSNICTWKDETPLIIVLKKKGMCLKIVKLLLESGADPNKPTCKGKTAMHYVCKKGGSVDIVKLLLKYRASVDLKEYTKGYTPFHYSIESVNDDVFQFLVNYVDVNMTDSDGETALFKACVAGFMKAIELILSKDKSCVNKLPSTGFSPLAVAVLHGNLSMVKLLVDSGADTGLQCCVYVPPCPSKLKKFLPIHSSFFSNVNVFKYLLEVTDPAVLLEFEKNTICGSLPIFTILYGSDSDYIETLLKHTFPPGHDDLKVASHEKLEPVVRCTNFDVGILVKKIPLFFKYYAHIEANTVFNAFKNLLNLETVTLTVKCDLIMLFSKIGLSNDSNQLKDELINLLNEKMQKDEDSRVLEGVEALKRGVLTLQQLSRKAARRFIRAKASDDWCAFCFIRDSGLPPWAKHYLWYEVLD